MSAELLAYPFLFVAIFFESFILVTFLSKPARVARGRAASVSYPTVAMIVPCYNEATTVAATCASLLALDYPREKLSIVLVDDGSRDATRVAMERFRDNPQVKIIFKENGGKHTALNAGIEASDAQIVGCLDADSFVDPAALREIIPCFEKAGVAAATAAMSVHHPRNLLQHMQNAEYIFGILLRHALSSVNGLYVTPGPFSLYRRTALEKVGLFRHAYQTEDMEMALRLQKEGYLIENAPRARVYTQAPNTLSRLIKQRTRWTTGFLRNILHEYRGLVGNSRYGALGMIVLPISLLAIASSVVLFLVSVSLAVSRLFHAYTLASSVPLSYTLGFHTPQLDWFYLPASLFTLLAGATILGSLSMIVIGRRLSATPTSLLSGIFSYTLLYGFIAPFWLMRALADVAVGKTRSWR